MTSIVPVFKSGAKTPEIKEDGTMKRTKVFTYVIGAAATVVVATHLLAQPKGPTVTVKGEVVDLWCYLEGGDRGAKHKECATTCAKTGNPIGIVDAKGNVYLIVGIEDHQTGQAVLIDKISQGVTITGTLVKKGGTQMLYVKSVK